MRGLKSATGATARIKSTVAPYTGAWIEIKSIAWVAYVTSDVYDFLIDSKLATTAKNSSANIDEQSLYKFKGFVLEETPDEYFRVGEQVMFVVDGVGIAGVGLQIVRAIDADDFYGVAIQGAGKYGKYIANISIHAPV